MTASRRTVIVAEGIAIRARQMSADSLDLPAATAAWNAWSAANPKLAEFASAEQFALFDRVNAAF